MLRSKSNTKKQCCGSGSKSLYMMYMYMTKIAGSGSASGSISQRHVSLDPDPDPPQYVMDPQHCKKGAENVTYIKYFFLPVEQISCIVPR